MFKDLKAMVEKYIVPQFDLKDLGKEALEAVAFVLIDRLREVAKMIPGTLDDELIEKLAVQADKIDGEKDRT